MVGQGLWNLKTLVRVLHPNVGIGVDYIGRLKLSALLICNFLVTIFSSKRVLFAAAMKNGAAIAIFSIGRFCNLADFVEHFWSYTAPDFRSL
jgi:hypothetical protein